MVYVADGYLVLKIQNAFLGEFDVEKEVVKIEAAALKDVWIKKGLFRDRLVLEPKRMELLDLIPGEHRTALELRVWRRYRDDLVRLVEEYEEVLEERAA